MRAAGWMAVMLALVVQLGCERSSAPTVVVYTSVDQPVAEPILKDFEKQSGIRVVIVTDVEATKTAGLVERLRAERNHPQADVWWNNEVFHTVNLAAEGVLAPYESPAEADIPAAYKDPQHRWAATALRVRVVALGEDPAVQHVKNLEDLADPALKGKIAMGRPALGTIGGQVAALYALWGQEKAEQYFRALRANDMKLLGGNSVVVQYVGSGQLSAGLTDNDDVASAQQEGQKVRQVLPDQDGMGTLAVPSTVSLVAGAPNPETARKLIDYLLSPQTGQRMREARYAAYDLRAIPGGVRFMQLDYAKVAPLMPQAVQSATAILEGR